MHRNNARVACIKIIRNSCTSHSHSHSHSNRQWKIFFARFRVCFSIWSHRQSFVYVLRCLYMYLYGMKWMLIYMLKDFLHFALLFSMQQCQERENSKRHLYGLNVKCSLTLSQNKMISFVRDGGEIYTYTRSHRNEKM